MKKLFYFLIFIVNISIFIVANAATIDTTPPVLYSIKHTNTTYKQGDLISFEINAEDDISGIDTIMIEFIISDSGPFTQDTSDFMVVGLNKEGLIFSNNKTGLNNFKNGKYTYSGYVPADAKLGEYRIYKIHIIDANLNCTDYCLYDDVCDVFTDYTRLDSNIGTIYIEKGDVDIEVPNLIDFSVSSTSVKVGESVKYTVKAKDVSGIKEVALFVDNNSYLLGKIDEDTYEVSITFQTPGTHVFKQLSLMDSNNNYGSFFYENQSSIYTHKNNKFDFVNGSYDIVVTDEKGSTESETPELTNIVLTKTKVKAPSLFYVYFYATPNSEVRLMLYNQEKGKGTNGVHMTQNGWRNDKYVYTIELSQYTDVGKYCIDALVLNDFGYQVFYTSKEDYKPYDNTIKLDKEYCFEVEEDYKTDVITSITDNAIIKKINDAKDDATIAIDTTKSTKITKNVFEAIKDTNKTIVFESNGVQWYFNGKDIVNPKDIDIETNIYYVENYIEEIIDDENEEIATTWDGENALVIEFPDNGNIPGKVLIKVKADYAFRQYLNSNTLYLYYQNGDMYDIISENIMASNDGFYEFYIDHNSTYYLTKKKISKEKIKANYTEKLSNDELASKIKEEVKENPEYNEDIDINPRKDVETNTTTNNNPTMNILLMIVVSIIIIISAVIVLILRKRNIRKELHR